MTPNPKDDPLGWLRVTSDRSWLSTAEAAEQLGITPGRLCRLRRLGHTPPGASMRVSRKVILWAALDQPIRSAPEEPPVSAPGPAQLREGSSSESASDMQEAPHVAGARILP